SRLLPCSKEECDEAVLERIEEGQQAAPSHTTQSDADPMQLRHASMAGTLGVEADHAAEDAVSGKTRAHFAGLLSRGTASAKTVQVILEEDLGLPVAVQPFAGGWLTTDATARSRLGTSQLGASGVLGERVWDPAGSLRLRVGPVGRSELEELLPGRTLHNRINSWMASLGLSHLAWDMQIILSADAFQFARLGQSCTIGRGCWLRTNEPREHLTDQIVTGASPYSEA
ncbi:MAG: type VI secretion system baseplate subunit TssG, partial [Planctomycetota bacterium]